MSGNSARTSARTYAALVYTVDRCAQHDWEQSDDYIATQIADRLCAELPPALRSGDEGWQCDFREALIDEIALRVHLERIEATGTPYVRRRARPDLV